MVVRFSQGHGGMEGKEGMFLSPLMMEEGRGGGRVVPGGGGRDVMPTSASKRSFLEYYQQLNLDRYLQAERRSSSGGCVSAAVIWMLLLLLLCPGCDC